MKRTGFKTRTAALQRGTALRTRHRMKRRRKPPTDHERFIAGLPCCVTGRTDGIQVHHLLRTPNHEHGTGKRSSERWAIPLHWEVHDALHADGNETRFLAGYGIDGPALAKALWDASGDYELACAILRGLSDGPAVPVRKPRFYWQMASQN